MKTKWNMKPTVKSANYYKYETEENIMKEFLENYIFWKKINKIFVFLFIVFDILFVFSGYFVIHKLSVFYILFHFVEL